MGKKHVLMQVGGKVKFWKHVTRIGRGEGKMQRERACLAEDMPRIYYSSSEISTDGISPR